MLYEVIKYIYPQIKDTEFSLQDDGVGAYIKAWAYVQPKPTKEELTLALPQVIAKQAVDKANNEVIAKLKLIDEKSIRSIREYIASKADTPSFLKEQETQAQSERGKLK